jgi:hypothetical protein
VLARAEIVVVGIDLNGPPYFSPTSPNSVPLATTAPVFGR